MLTDIRSLLPDELTAVCKEMGLPAFRAKQIFDGCMWIVLKLLMK